MDGKAYVGQRFGYEPAHGWGCGRARERVALRQAERRVDVAFGRNPVAPELPPAAALAQGEHAPPDGKLSVRGEDPGDIHT